MGCHRHGRHCYWGTFVNRLEFEIHGKDAHAGAAPEKGINAILLASKAIAKLELGRIDHETTCNIGIIEGGIAINIVPNLVRVKGEVRSHDENKNSIKLLTKLHRFFRELLKIIKVTQLVTIFLALRLTLKKIFPALTFKTITRL